VFRLNIQQLRAICEVVRRDMNISLAADHLCKAQPVISRQLKELEQELQLQLFYRTRNRLSGLTPAGRAIYQNAESVLRELSSLRVTAEEWLAPDHGSLTIATTHTHARYSLPTVIDRFSKQFPGVRLSLRQGNPLDACERVRLGEADVAICSEPSTDMDDLAVLPIYRIAWDVVVAADHPLASERRVTLEAVTAYPIIVNDPTFSGQRILAEALAPTRRNPFVFLEGVDADVSKAYVERGLAVAILARITYEPAKDRGLRLLNLDHLFRPSVIALCFRKQHALRSYTLKFMQSFAPHLSVDTINRALAGVAIDRKRMAKEAPLLKHR
jgi:LysR family cys regulon transcriptional activator